MEKKLIDNIRVGHVYHCKSKTFGESHLFCLEVPGETINNRIKFFPVKGEKIDSALHLVSVENDIILNEWDSIFEYHKNFNETKSSSLEKVQRQN